MGPLPGRATAPVSFRILRSQFAGSAPSPPAYRCTYQFLLVDANGSPVPRGPPAPCDVVINGPAFRVDPCDHPAEPWLTRDAAQSGFAGSAVDNDNDGVADGRWLSEVLPMVRRADGRSIRCDVSILVKDLDGRINLNAHGTTRRHSQTGKPYRARSEYGYLRRTVPIGMGFGPADIDASGLFSTVTQFATDGSTVPSLGLWFDGRLAPIGSTWDVLLRGDADAAVPSYPLTDAAPWLQRRPAPVLGTVLGRYSGPGSGGVAGIAGQEALSQNQDSEFFMAPYGSLVGKANSFSDFKSRLQVATQAPANGKGVASLLFYSPDIDSDVVDHPYELRLDRNAPRFGSNVAAGDQAADNLFTLNELERVLRQFDPDASQLSPRLAAVLGARLREDRDEDGQTDSGETDPDLKEAGDDNPWDDGEDRLRDNKRPNGILDKNEDTNGNGYLDLASDVNGSGFRDTPEDRNQNGQLDRYWPREASNPPDFPRQSWERDFTQPLRDLITTDSWDTPGLTGLAAKKIEKYLLDNPKTAADFSPDLVSGLRFDVNRPIPFLFLDASTGHVYEDRNGNGNLDSGEDGNGNGRLDPFATSNQQYCKHLFYVLMALGVSTPKDAAQWAANIADFRDADSVMTAFEYDPTPSDGWSIDGDLTTNDGNRGIVFGVERPELVITEAASWGKDPGNGGFTQGQVFVMLHRPWDGVARNFVNTSSAIPPQVSQPFMAEPIDVRLTVSSTVPLEKINASRLKETGDRNGNGVSQEPALDLELQCSGTSVWRLVLGPGSPNEKIVRFDTPPTLEPNEFGVNTNRAALRAVTSMPANSYLCVASGQPQEGITVSGSMFAIDTGNLFVPTAGDTVIELQRLADPWGKYDPVVNPHVPVDRFTVRTIDRTPDATTNVPKKPWQRTKRAWSEPKLGEELSDPSTPADPTKTLTNFWRSTRLVDGGPRPIPPNQEQPPDPQYPGEILPVPGGPTDLPPSLGPLDFVAPCLHWPNRPFVSVGELLLVPRQAAAEWLQGYKLPCTDPGPSGAPAEQLIFDACHVYTRFAGNRITLTGSNNLALIGADRIPFDQLSRWREPGRVNLYTGTSPVVRALVANRLDGRDYPLLRAPDSGPLPSPKAPTMRPTQTLLCNTADGSVFMDTSPEYAIKQAGKLAPPDKDDHVPFNPSLNPFFCFNTAIRMPNVATTRSHVFAVWITLRMTDTADPDAVTFRRLFAIVDRSTPVGFIHGMDLNARDAVVLQRYLD